MHVFKVFILLVCAYQGVQYFTSLPVLLYLQAVFFYQNLNNFYEYLIQHSLKSGGTKDHFRWVKVPGIPPLLKGMPVT